MGFKIRTACVVAAMLVGTASFASAQGGGGTDYSYKAKSSQGVGSKGRMTAPSEHATTGSTAGTRHSKKHMMRGETAHHTTSKSKTTGQSY